MRHLLGPGSGLQAGHPLPVLLVGFLVNLVQQAIYSELNSVCDNDGE